jgi:cytochrome c biogenesis protein CcdA/thiol-disulfide isomerase/thioredoxin
VESLALIGFLGGLITGISPCILPVLPVIFLSGGAQSARSTEVTGRATVSRWRPYTVIAGLVVAFSIFTLLGSLLLSFLNLPQDTLRWAGIVVLALIGVGLIIPFAQHLLEKPFSWIPQRQVSTERGGFLLGLALGAVYVPCAGPVLAAITVAGSTGRVGPETIVLVVSFAIGTAIPLLVFALAGRGVAERVKAFRTHQRAIRVTGGVVMIALAIGLIFNVPAQLQTLVPDYTASLQSQFVENEDIAEQLDLGGIINEQNKDLDKCTNGADVLESCGTAPDIKNIEKWCNTADGQGIDLEELRGQVVLIDFWAYSCINCQRALPKLTSWDRTYRDSGLTVIGVHSPEYAFEKVPANVEAGIERYRIEYPVALDNSLSTWTNYRNRYWPAQYLIDAEGVVRHVQFGEGKYSTTEALLRELLVDANPSVRLPLPTGNIDRTPVFGSTTPESYFGLGKVVNFGGAERYGSGPGQFSYPGALGEDQFAFDGDWTLDFQNVTPTSTPASIKLNYTASEVRIVLSGEGTMTLTINGESEEIMVGGAPNSYRLIKTDDIEKGTLEVTLEPTLQAYSFTFG